jgi:hypothetical protein
MPWSNKKQWTADEWKAYRRSKGIPPKADMPTILPPHIAANGRELAMLMMAPLNDLNWPRDLYSAAVNTTAPLYRSTKPTVDTICHQAACTALHNNRVSATKTVAGAHYVRWFCCGDHQRRWVSAGSPL